MEIQDREHRWTNVECALRDLEEKLLFARNVSENSGSRIIEPALPIPEFRCLPAPVLHGGRFGFFRGLGGEAISSIFGDCTIDDSSAVDAFPGIEGQEKVRESFQHHQSFALRAIHDYFLPCYETERAQGNSN